MNFYFCTAFPYALVNKVITCELCFFLPFFFFRNVWLTHSILSAILQSLGVRLLRIGAHALRKWVYNRFLAMAIFMPCGSQLVTVKDLHLAIVTTLYLEVFATMLLGASAVGYIIVLVNNRISPVSSFPPGLRSLRGLLLTQYIYWHFFFSTLSTERKLEDRQI